MSVQSQGDPSEVRDRVEIDPKKIREECWERQERTRSLLTPEGLDGLVVVGRSFYDCPGSQAYLTNHFPPFPTSPFTDEVRGLGYSVFVFPREKELNPTLIVDHAGVRRDLVAAEDIRISVNLSREVCEVLKEQGWREAVIGLVGEDLLPLSLIRDWQEDLPGITWVGADRLLDRQRRLKSPLEQQLLRRAAAVADEAHAAVLPLVEPGQTERHICATGIAAAMNAGADFVRYLRVHSGDWSAWGSRWPQATERVLEKGDLVTLDIIGAVSGYQFDVLRTACAGEPTERALRLLDAAADATDAMVSEVRPGVTVEALVAVAHRVIEAADFGAYASPFCGHGIGLDTVEPPYLQPKVDDVLETGMTLCLEPGIFIPHFGGACIEEEVIVTEDGCEVLSRAPTRPWQLPTTPDATTL